MSNVVFYPAVKNITQGMLAHELMAENPDYFPIKRIGPQVPYVFNGVYMHLAVINKLEELLFIDTHLT